MSAMAGDDESHSEDGDFLRWRCRGGAQGSVSREADQSDGAANGGEFLELNRKVDENEAFENFLHSRLSESGSGV